MQKFFRIAAIMHKKIFKHNFYTQFVEEVKLYHRLKFQVKIMLRQWDNAFEIVVQNKRYGAPDINYDRKAFKSSFLLMI